jgi:hypothetical protein
MAFHPGFVWISLSSDKWSTPSSFTNFCSSEDGAGSEDDDQYERTRGLRLPQQHDQKELPHFLSFPTAIFSGDACIEIIGEAFLYLYIYICVHQTLPARPVYVCLMQVSVYQIVPFRVPLPHQAYGRLDHVCN